MLKAPAKVMGNHKSFEKAYIQYVAGCQEMTDSLLPKVNEEAFNAAEKNRTLQRIQSTKRFKK